MVRKSLAEEVRRRMGYVSIFLITCFVAWKATPAMPVLWAPKADDRLVAEGKVLFEHQWSPGDSLASVGGDGLGPVFNAKSCSTCHFQGGVGGSGGKQHVVVSYTVHPTIRDRHVRDGVVHAFAVNRDLLETRKNVNAMFPIVPGGVRVFEDCQTKFEDFDPVHYENIDTPALFGAGWIDRMSPKAITQNRARRAVKLIGKELAMDFSGGSLGRHRQLPDGRIGKFGWKAQFATLEEFVAAACANEIGLSTPDREQATPLGRSYPKSAPDLDDRQFGAMVAFVDTLPRPTQKVPRDPIHRQIAEKGEGLFHSVGCASCHTPEVGGIAGVYSDFMLHKLVDDPESAYGGDSIPEVPWPDDVPSPDEWKTPALWGVADSAPYFHDGATPDLHGAIVRHKGGANAVTERYLALNEKDRNAVIVFLRTLRAPKGESDPSARMVVTSR